MRDQLTTYERRERIRLLLVKEKSTTTTYLMDLFGVTKPTILDDIVFLSSIMPIVTLRVRVGASSSIWNITHRERILPAMKRACY